MVAQSYRYTKNHWIISLIENFKGCELHLNQNVNKKGARREKSKVTWNTTEDKSRKGLWVNYPRWAALEMNKRGKTGYFMISILNVREDKWYKNMKQVYGGR